MDIAAEGACVSGRGVVVAPVAGARCRTWGRMGVCGGWPNERLDTQAKMNHTRNRTPLRQRNSALKPNYLGFLIVITTCVLGACRAFLTVVKRPEIALRPILRVDLAIYLTSFPGPLPAALRLGLGSVGDSLAW